MAQSNVLKRYLDAGMAFTAMTQAKAEALVKDLVSTGEVQAEQAQAAVTDLLERSRKNTEAFLDQVRRDIADSAESLGLATIADLTRVERLIDSIRAGTTDKPARRAAVKTSATAKKATPAKATAAKKTATKKAAAKKATAKKATGTKKASAKKATGTVKATAKKAAGSTKTSAKKASSAKKAPAKKAAAKKAPAKKAPASTSTASSSTTSGAAGTTTS